MSRESLLQVLDEGVQSGRLSPQLAAYIAAEVLGVDARTTGYDDTIRLNDEV
jgi:2-polyprenyl-3-methyl-5-hydroxy-6-metoxy-1,4-benzoquinol methylase